MKPNLMNAGTDWLTRALFRLRPSVACARTARLFRSDVARVSACAPHRTVGPLLLGLLATGFAHADALEGVYVVGGFGPGRIQLSCSGTTACAPDATGYALGAGKRLLDSALGGELAVELRWMSVGSARVTNTALEAKISSKLLSAGLRWTRPLGANISFSAGAGIAQVRTAVDVTTLQTQQISLPADRRVTAHGMVGLNYDVGDGGAIELMYLQSQARYNRNALDLGTGRLSGLTLGFLKRF